MKAFLIIRLIHKVKANSYDKEKKLIDKAKSISIVQSKRLNQVNYYNKEKKINPQK